MSRQNAGDEDSRNMRFSSKSLSNLQLTNLSDRCVSMVEEFNKLVDANTSVSESRTQDFLTVKSVVLPTSSSSVGMLRGS